MQREDLRLAVAQLEAQREQDLDELVEKAAAALAAPEPHDLHAERAAAADDAPLLQIEARRPRERERIDAGVPLEALVLVCDDGVAELLGHALAGRKAPLAVLGD